MPNTKHNRETTDGLLELGLLQLTPRPRNLGKHRYDHIAANTDVSTRRINIIWLKTIHWAYHNTHPDYVANSACPAPSKIDSDYTSAQLDT